MADTGSLIEVHSHSNLKLLNGLSEIDGELYLYGELVCKEYTETDFTDEEIQSMVSAMITDLEAWETVTYGS